VIAEEVEGSRDDPEEVEADGVAVLLGSVVFEEEGEREEIGLLVEV